MFRSKFRYSIKSIEKITNIKQNNATKWQDFAFLLQKIAPPEGAKSLYFLDDYAIL